MTTTNLQQMSCKPSQSRKNQGDDRNRTGATFRSSDPAEIELRLRIIHNPIGNLVDIRVETAESGMDLGRLPAFAATQHMPYAAAGRVEIAVPTMSVTVEER